MDVSASRCVKLYVCSNPDDSVYERRALRENVFPNLRERCRQTLGLDVRVIDPFESSDRGRWPDEVCRRQLITDCRESSAGPCLLVLVGHRYGSASLPPHIEVSDFLLLLQQSQRGGGHTGGGHTAGGLETAYQRDENVIPPSFSRRRPGHGHQAAAAEEDEDEEGEEDEDEEEELRTKFQNIVSLSVQNQAMSLETSQRYCRSALDADLRFALEEPDDDIIKRCLVYVHKVVNAKGERERERDGRQSETCDVRNVDPLLSLICDDFLPGLIVSRQLRVYTITTQCDRRHGYTTARRRSYAQSLCQQVTSDLVASIHSLNVTEKDSTSREQADQEEMSDVIARLYDITRPEEEKVRVYVEQSEQRLPLVVTGEPCTGKTVLLAHCVRQIRSWLPGSDPVVISYFSDLSINPSPAHLLLSVCSQIRDRYHRAEPDPDPDLDLCLASSSTRLPELKARLRSVVSSSASADRPLVLVLDGLDQMNLNFAPRVLEILPIPLPPAVKVVVSVSSRRTQSVGPSRCVLHGGERESLCVRLQPVERKRRVKMLEELLSRSGRRVTSGQQAVVNRALTSCRLILYARLLHLHTALWHSDTEVSDSSLPDGVHSSISALLDHLEQKHGSFMVSRAVSFLTLSRSGLSEAELADLLTLDPAVRDRRRPPVSTVPQVDVDTLLLDLRRFLITRTVAGSCVLFWVSRHFKLVVAKRCLGSPGARREIHSAMADYFGAGTNDVHDTRQPFVFASGSVNFRKILELPYHLRESERWEEWERGLVMSFNFQQALVRAGLLGDLVDMLESEDGPSCSYTSRERSLVANTLKSSACFLQKSPLQLASVLETNILPYLEVLPALQDYISEIRRDRRTTGSGLGVLLCPSPSSVPHTRCVKVNAKLDEDEVSVREATGTECGIVAQVMDDGTAWIWKSSKCNVDELSVRCEREEQLRFAHVKSSGRFVLLSTECHKLFLWDVSGPETFQRFEDASQTVEGFAAYREKLFIWWKDESFVSVFDVHTARWTRFQCQSCVTCLVCSSNGVYMYCGQEDGSLSVFDAGGLLGTCSNSDAVASMILCEDACEVACVDRTGSLTVWDVASKKNPPRLVTESLSRSKSHILNVDYSREFSTLLACQSHHVALWDTCDWELWGQFSAPKGRAFTQAVLSQDGHLFLASLDARPFVLVWCVGSGECVLSLETNARPRALLKLASHVVCVSGDGRLTAWDSGMVDAAGTSPKMGRGVTDVVVEQSGGRFYTSDGSDTVWRWSLETGLPHANLLHDGPVEKMRLSPNNVHLVTLSAGEIYVWQSQTGQNVVRVGGSRASDVLITPNGSFGVSLSQRGLSRVWKLASGSIVCDVHLSLSDAQVSSESTFLIGRHGGDLLAASLWSGLISKRFSCSESAERVVAFHALSEHADFAVVMCASGAVFTWNVAAGTLCRHFLLPSGFHCRPQEVQTSSDGSYVLLSSQNETINLLDLSRGRLCSFKADGPIVRACLDKNGRFVVYVSRPGLEKRCGCFRHAEFVLTVLRLADGEIIGSVCLEKDPVSVVVCECVFLGFQDGSVGVYSVPDVTVDGAESTGCRRDLKQCPCDRATTWLPLATPNITWP